jgi:multidrug transporter EmrE-like cation transporter
MISPHGQAWLMVITAAVSTCFGNLLLKKSRMATTDLGFVASFGSPWFLCALIFMIAYVLLFSKALDTLSISSVYPVYSGTVFMLLILSAVLFLGERFQPGQFFGLGLIVGGIVIVTHYSQL